ncbi:MAG: hypothetical protein V4727_03425 [Verrucomicrobiota bacterium]
MNVSYFIGISSALLLTWLGVTYFHQVPHESYPKQKRLSRDTAISIPSKDTETIPTTVSITE